MPKEVNVGTEIETLKAAREIVLWHFNNAPNQSKDSYAGYEFWQAYAALYDCIKSIKNKENSNG